MSELLDRAGQVRAGEELEAERLRRYLEGRLPGAGVGPARLGQYRSGHSNLTYELTLGEQRYILRRPPFGSKVKSAHDMGREYRVLAALHGAYPRAPEPLLYCEDPEVIGAPFYVMRRIEGIILRKELPASLQLSPAQVRALHLELVAALAELHAVDWRAAGLEALGRPEGYVERQVTGWTQRYVAARTDDIPAMEEVAAWLAGHRPPERGACLIHNDYKLDNVVLSLEEPTRIIGVLDWEMSTLGCPLMDLGTALSYWVQADDPAERQLLRWGPTTVPGSLSRAELIQAYARASSRPVPDAAFYAAFGLFKTAVVLQQIYYRYQQGLTTDERFAPLILGVGVLANAARATLERGAP